jgi:5-methylcytosine-specific restriction enzyme subunit McrC
MLIAGEGSTRIHVRSLWMLLMYASDMFEEMTLKERESIVSGQRDADLIDVVAEVLVREVEFRLRRQLTHHYAPQRADLTRVRGRIDHLRNLTHRLNDQGRVACRFESLTINTPRNRFIAATMIFAAPSIVKPELARRCRSAAAGMHRLGVSPRPPARGELSADRLSHHDAQDKRMLDAAYLLRDMALPIHDSGSLEMPRLSEDFRSHRTLFEAAVRGFFVHRLKSGGWRVGARILGWLSPDYPPNPFMPSMKTDVVLEDPTRQRRIVIETKFTDALIDRDGRTTLKAEYLYQLYSYLASQVGRGNPAQDRAEGVLLFVKTEGREKFFQQVMIQKHPFRFISVDLTETPDRIRHTWMKCVAPVTFRGEEIGSPRT